MEYTLTNQKAVYKGADIARMRAEVYRHQKALRLRRTILRLSANVAMVLIVLLPLLYAVSVAFMPSNELFTTELNLVPKHSTLENFKGKNLLFMLVMATMMIPGEATIISNYLMVSGWGWLDSYQALIVPYLTSAMGIFLFRQFYLTFPISLYESAKIDGCTNLRFIVQILFPLTKSAVGAMAVYTFINAWNMYMWPLLVTGSDKMRTVQIGISMLDSVDSQSITLMIAGVVMLILPSLSIFIFGQKQLIRGMFSGAVKG